VTLVKLNVDLKFWHDSPVDLYIRISHLPKPVDPFRKSVKFVKVTIF